MQFTDLSSAIFNLLWFTGFAVLVAFYVLRLRGMAGKRTLYTLFLLLGGFAVLTQLSYVDAPERIFTNVDHHVIEHLGFSFNRKLVLVDEQSPQKAIWDDKRGYLDVRLRNEREFVMGGKAFYEPVFVQQADRYRLVNPVFRQPVRQEIAIDLADTLKLTFRVQPPAVSAREETYSFTTKVNGHSYGPFPIRRTNLQTGYSLGKLLAETQADAPAMSDFIDALDSAWVLREEYRPDKPLPVETTPLLFFPSPELLALARSMAIDGKPVPVRSNFSFQTSIRNLAHSRQSFYVGLWRPHTPTYTLTCPDVQSGYCEWRTNTPNRKYLKKLDQPGESLFITSSAEDVTDNELLGGFYYPLLERSDNLNHISANVTYREGSTRQKMSFRVVNIDRNDLTNTPTSVYRPGDLIRLETIGASQGQSQIAWLFQITDLKATNPLQFYHLLLFTLGIVAGIFGLIYLAPPDQTTKTEVIACIVILTFMTVRSILLWRVSTFLPLENISAKVYGTLALSGLVHFKRGVYMTLGFFGLLWMRKIYGARIQAVGQSAVGKIRAKFGGAASIHPAEQAATGLSLWNLALFLAYFLAAGVKWAAKFVNEFERIGAVYAPLFVYFSIQFYLLYRVRRAAPAVNRTPEFRFLALLNSLICVGYLALTDAGFSIVFILFSLFYWMIRILTFPDASARARHLRFLIPLTLLFALVLFLPYFLSFIFQHTGWCIQIICGGLVLLAVYWLICKPIIWANAPLWLRPGFVGGLLILASIGIFLNQQRLIDTIQNKNYIRYRSEVLISKPDEIIQSEEFKFSLGNDSKLLRAAQNQWLISYYYDKGSFNPYTYFRILPSFQKGSPYLTQISDLVTVRYVIGEHSQWIIIQLLFLLILLIRSALENDTRFNLYSQLRLQAVCLLFTVGFFIWLAATNRMVFLGQDFPLLSINSFLTLVFTFSALAVAIIFSQLANAESDRQTFSMPGKKLTIQTMRIALILAGFLIYVREYKFDEDRFSLDATVNHLQQSFEVLNERFLGFQRDNGWPLTPGADSSTAQLVHRFDAYIRPDKDSLFKNSFVRSAYEAYQNVLATRNSADNLIHLRRSNDGLYEFAVNKLYYNVYSPDAFKEAWRGNLIASAGSLSLVFQNRDSRGMYSLNPKQRDARFEHTLNNYHLFNGSLLQNIKITVLPATWVRDTLPAILISRTSGDQRETRAHFSIKNGSRIFSSTSPSNVVRLMPNDVLQFIPNGGSKITTIQYKHRNENYLAKNVWLNSRRQFFYPLRHKFLWSYHFANLVKSKFDTLPDSWRQNLRVTIDYDLTEQIYNQAAAYFSKAKWKGKEAQSEKARAFNLVVLDDKGQIRALSDYKKGARWQVNPNRMSDYQALFNEQYLNAQTSDERQLFANRCLTRMDNGPASTFKPILYGAVTSQYDFGWPSLTFGEVDQETRAAMATPSGESYVLHRFGGRPVKFVVDKETLIPHDNQHYISHSTNTYNSEVVFLGSLDRPQIRAVHEYVRSHGTSPTFLTSERSAILADNFPYFDYNGRHFRINRFPVSWSNYNSLLAMGLWDNFRLPIRTEQIHGIAGQQLRNLASDLDSSQFDRSNSVYKLWSFPEPSHIYLVDRTNLHNAIVQVATGADPINVTPLKMAEMAGMLFSFNRSFKAGVIEKKTVPYSPLKADQSWVGQQNLVSFYSQNLFKAMNGALKPGGTAEILVGNMLKTRFPNYHFYAKTGTISGNRFSGKRDKHLMLIVSRDQLHDRVDITPGTLKNNRFYVLYFSFYKQSNGANWGGDAIQVLQKMVQTVLESPNFKSHMQ